MGRKSPSSKTTNAVEGQREVDSRFASKPNSKLSREVEDVEGVTPIWSETAEEGEFMYNLTWIYGSNGVFLLVELFP
ncbi:jg9942 [Pararge aegeria aegeria]|uniref:Jg9942 protein n=1 Tax=Pararge aegeria aegeria TaxID=348720 RepID=A0A8S4S9X9_9NEOP|nr:jg9942 [Pararge aegeria aegeria]